MGLSKLSYAQYTSNTALSDFTEVSAWDGGTPVFDGTETFTILNGHTYEINSDVSVGELTVESGATLRTKSGDVFTLTANDNITVEGTLDLYDDILNQTSLVWHSSLGTSFTLSGGGSIELGNVTFKDPNEANGTTASYVVSRNLDIQGNVTIEDDATFVGGTNTITVGGSWSEITNGAAYDGSAGGTVIFTNDLAIALSSDATSNDLIFHNVEFNGGGIVNFGAEVFTTGNFIISSNTTVNTGLNVLIDGDFSVESGSSYNQTLSTTNFDGFTNQSITLSGDVTFYNVRFADDDGVDNLKTIVGDLKASGQLHIDDLTELSTADLLSFNSFRLSNTDLDATAGITGDIEINGGTVYDDEANGVIDLSNTGSIKILGSSSIQAGDEFKVNDFFIEDGINLTINDGAQLTGKSSSVFSLGDNSRLQLRGADNFPNGFSTANYSVHENSFIYYNGALAQNIEPTDSNWSYGSLYLDEDTKTLTGNVDIANHIYLRDDVTLELSTFDVNLAGNIYNEDGGSITSASSGYGTFTFDGVNNAQTVQELDGGTSYSFGKIQVNKTGLTQDRNVTFYDNINFKEEFVVSNPDGAENAYLVIDLRDHVLTNDFTGASNFSIGDFVELRTSSTSEFLNANSSTIKTFSTNGSVIRFNGANQTIPTGIIYNNIELSGSGVKTAGGSLDVEGDFSRVGGNIDFSDNSQSITIGGDWLMDQDWTIMTGSLTFDGGDQTVRESNFNNVTFAGSGTKTISGTLIINGDLSINDGVTVSSSDESLTVGGDWTENGTGTFSQLTGTTTLESSNGQDLTTTSNSTFGNLHIKNDRGVEFYSDVVVSRNFDLDKNNAEIDLDVNTLFVGRYFYFDEGTTINYRDGAIIHFNGDQEQRLQNANTASLPSLVFSGNGEKIITDKEINVDGDITIDGAYLDANSRNISLTGNWNNTGTFESYRAVTFNGTNQTISSSNFHDLVISTTGTTTLEGNVVLSGYMDINAGATLDVSSSNYSISVEEGWTNDGAFEAQEGTVTFVGGNANIYPHPTEQTGEYDANNFYNVVFELGSNNTVSLYSTFDVDNDLTINSGILHTRGMDVYVGGSFVNNATFSHSNDASLLTLNASSGTHLFNPGTSSFRDITVDASGAVYELQSDLSISGSNNRLLTVQNGELSLNGNSIEFSSGTDILINGGILDVDEGADLVLGTDATITMSNGAFKVVGTESSPASLASSDPDTGDFYTYTQTGGTIHAKNYIIQNTKDGLDIQGGSIDATDNFSNGIFSDGTGSQYLKLNSISFTDFDVLDVVFNEGPTNNVERSGGSGVVTFKDYLGSLGGEAYENDAASFIEWDNDALTIVKWDGDAGDGLWNTATNWSGDAIPTSTDNVVLDNSLVAGNYNVSIPSAVQVNNLDINGDLTLSLNGNTLDINDLTFTDGTFELGTSGEVQVGGNYIVASTAVLNAGTSTVKFDGVSGASNLVSVAGSNGSFYNVTFEAEDDEARYMVSSDLSVTGDFTLTSGLFDILTASTITVEGNWQKNGGIFQEGTSTVDFSGASDQSISGGVFYNVILSGGSNKSLSSNMTIQNDLTISADAGTVLKGEDKLIFVKGDWVNNNSTAAFDAGTSSVIFNGGNQSITGTSSTEFSTLYLTGSGNKYFYESAHILKEMLISSTGTVQVEESVSITGEATASLEMTNGTMTVKGANNFPSNFGTYQLLGGAVEYRADLDQNIYQTTYYNLILDIPSTDAYNKNLLGDITVNGYLNIDKSNVVFNVNNHTLELEGNLGVPTSTTINWGTGTLIHKGGGWNIDRDITDFNNLILRGTSTKALLADLSVTGDLTVEDGVSLDLNDYELNGGGAFTLEGAASMVVNDHPSTTEPAFANGFSSYSLSENSTVTISAPDAVILPSGVTFGRLNLRGTLTASLEGDLDVDGIFDMSSTTFLDTDNGHDLYLAGSYVDLQNYTASNSSTVYFDGADQTIRNDLNSGSETFELNDVVFSGSGTKTLDGGNDIWNIAGDVTVNSGAFVRLSRQMNVAGSFTNNGSFTQTSNTYGLEFNGVGDIDLNFGVENQLRNVFFNGSGGTYTLITNGMKVINGYLNISSTSIVDFGSLTHELASNTHSFEGTINSTNASFIFNRTGDQYLPAIDLSFEDFTISGTGRKYIPANTYTIDDLHVESSPYLYLSEDGGENVSTLIVKGNWLNEGRVYTYTSNVYLDSDDTTTKTITSGGYEFYNLIINEYQTNARTYQIQDELYIENELQVKANATLEVINNTLRLGNNDTDYPLGETHTVEANGAIYIGENGILEFDGNDQDQTLNVSGSISFVGSTENLAKIERRSGNQRLAINILSGGSVAASFYEFSHIAHTGFIVNSGATIDATHNFSDGLWTGISTSNSGDYRYLQIDNDLGAGITINNVMFNHDRTPSQGVHYNVGRLSTATGKITFDGQINGRLAGATYEDDQNTGDADGLIVWSGTTDITWEGAVSADWNTAANWSSGTVPTSTENVVIPLGSPNNPIISTTAECNKLTISNGILSLTDAADLTVSSDLTIGTGTYAGILTAASGATIELDGSLDMSSNAIFKGTESTFNFTPLAGTVNLTANANSEFGNIIYNGDVDFRMIGSEIHVLGSMTLSNGNLSAITSNYTHYVAKDLLNNGGDVSASTTGLFVLNGDNQTVKDFVFNDLQIDGTGVKTFEGTNTIEDDLTIVSNLTSAATATINFKGDVIIESGATFDDGGTTHYFSGRNWKGEGSYAGAGTIEFVSTGDQYIEASKFNNLDLNLAASNEVYLMGDVDVTGDVYLRSNVNYLYTDEYLIQSTNGTGEFVMEASSRIQVQGANNFPDNFGTYSMDESSTTFYNGVVDQTVKGNVAYGRLDLRNPNTKTLSDDITVQERLYINDATLDVSTSNYTLTLYDDFYNNSIGSFLARSGEVIFAAPTADDTNYQDIYLGAEGTKDFYDLTVNSERRIDQEYATLNILNNFRIDKGDFRISDNDDNLYVSGNITIQDNGNFQTRGTLNLIKNSGPAFITSGGSTFNNVIINGDASFSLEDEFALNGNFTQLKGTFDLNGNKATLGNSSDVMTVESTFKVGPAGQLVLGSNVTFEVSETGRFEAIGTSSEFATIESTSGTRYNFIVNGTIAARYYIFSDLNLSGLNITSTGTIDETDNLSYGSFSRGIAGGTYLRIENTQNLTSSNRIEELTFVDDPGNGATNVTKLNAASGDIEFYNTRGNLSGENFDNDPYDLISFLGDETLTWVGSVSENWFLASNWSSNLGAGKVPTGLEDIIISSTAVNAPVVDGSIGTALAKSLTVESGAFLNVLSEVDGSDLIVSGDVTIEGVFTNSGNDVDIEVQGNWSKSNASAVFSPGESTVSLNTTTGTKYINNSNSTFNNLVVSNGHYIFEENTIILGNLSVETTGTLEVDNTSSLDVYVGGNLSNEGTLTPNNSSFYFNASDGATKTVLTGGVAFNDVYFNPSVSNTYQLSDNLTIDGNAYVDMTSLDLNSYDMSVGTDATDKLEVANSATLEVNGGETLALGSGTDLVIANGGKINLLGSSESNRAKVSSRVNMPYSFTVESGATINGEYYLIEYLDENGLEILSGATIEETSGEAMTNGEFSNGENSANSRYLHVVNDLGSGITFSEVRFNSGPTYNVVRESGSGNLTVFNSTGALSGYTFEKDDQAVSDVAGLILWTYDNAPFIWQGDVSTDWHTSANWDRDAVPSSTSEVFIPQGTANAIISTANAEAKGLTFQEGGHLTITSGYNLNIEDYLDINSETFIIQDGSSSTVTVGENILNLNSSGSSYFGDASTLVLESESATPLTLYSDISLNNLTINGTATYSTDVLDVNGNLTIQNGGLELANTSSTLNVGGNIDVQASGTLNLSTGEVTLDGANQDITFTGTASLNNLKLNGTDVKTLKSSTSVHNLVISSTSTFTIDGGISLAVDGDWTNSGVFNHGNGTVTFEGDELQNIYQSGTGDFYNFIVNNDAPGFAINLNDPINVASQLTFTDGIILGGTNETISFGTSSSVTGASASSYIDGVAIKEGGSDFIFPVGKNGILAQLGLYDYSGSSSTFKVEYIEGNANTLSSTYEAGQLEAVSRIEYWDLERTSGTDDANVRLYWTDNERSLIYKLDEISVAHLDTDDNTWYTKGGDATGPATTAGSVGSDFPLTEYGYVTFGSSTTDNLLPISLSYFVASYKAGEVLLEWETSSEINNDYFTVERSIDGVNFESIEKVEGAGYSDLSLYYSVIDDSPYHGTSYYRLKQTDFSGRYTYTAIVLVSRESDLDDFTLKLYPNPLRNTSLNIELGGLKKQEDVSLEVYDVFGKKVMIKQLKSDTSGFLQWKTEELSSLSAGVYILLIDSGRGVVQQRLVIE
ncbi:hypothetical protein BC781_103356 [Sediminitomix flava]|uniref:Secretion system C-terminal sorting domain-containing protein n=2 Tax=Sediminitomix flava TaxID=379075 RepID=A0A315Z957_SEDFL|nr:hypothetical protein BC781_103356 [Sediminitomix flava]